MTTPTNMLSTLEDYLNLTTQRQQTIAENMANVDTPGYHTRDVDFQRELHRAMTSEVEFESGSVSRSGQLTPAFAEVGGLLERPDGNNVSLDRESLALSQTQLQYQIGVQLVKHHFHGLLSAISGGGQG